MAIREEILKRVWEYIADDEDLAWIDNVAAQPADNGPMGDFGEITRRMLAAGVSKQDIARFARINGYEAAFGTLYSIGSGVGDVSLRLQAFDDETDKSVDAKLGGLYESLLGSDPTGREMRPKR
jgi:hypothetical protein